MRVAERYPTEMAPTSPEYFWCARNESTCEAEILTAHSGRPGVDWPVRILGGSFPPLVYSCAEEKPQLGFADECTHPGYTAEILHYAMRGGREPQCVASP